MSDGPQLGKLVGSAADVREPTDLFPCQPLHAPKMPARDCVKRQGAFMQKTPLYLPCGTGKCTDGLVVLSAIGPPPASKHRWWWRPDLRAQVAAKRRKARRDVGPLPAERAAPAGGSSSGRARRRETTSVKTCREPGCGKLLRPGRSVGDRCFRCRLRRGEIRIGTIDPTRPPDPRTLSAEYLDRCALERDRRRKEG